MSALKDLGYDIEQLFIDGFSPSRIATILECPVGTVYDWLEANGLIGDVVETPQEELSPFNTSNS